MGVRIMKVLASGCIDLSDRPAVGILAFEVAPSMARLLSLHRTLADDHILPLFDNMRSLGVANFFSTDPSFLPRLACAELVADLDAVAATVARFSLKCRDPLLRGFDRLYGSVKAVALRRGRVADLDRLGFGSMAAKSAAKTIKKMEKYLASTSLLQKELLELEESEKAQRKQGTALEALRLNVRGLKERSLWSWTFDEIVQPMAGAVFTVLARIYDVFGPKILRSTPARNHGLNFFNTPSSADKDVHETIEKLPSLEAWPSTVGGSGLSFHYAELIAIAKSLFARWELSNGMAAGLMAMRQIEAAVREVVYHKMTPSMRCAVRAKLKEIWQRKKNDRTEMASMEPDWWRNELQVMLGWLGPAASSTRRWEEEQRSEQFLVGPRVLLWQTLHFADRNLTEKAIVDFFVGLMGLVSVPYEQYPNATAALTHESRLSPLPIVDARLRHRSSTHDPHPPPWIVAQPPALWIVDAHRTYSAVAATMIWANVPRANRN